MTSLNNITVQISFHQTQEKFIFSTNLESTIKMTNYLKSKNYSIKDLYLLENNKFKKITTKQFINYFNFHIELLENLSLI